MNPGSLMACGVTVEKDVGNRVGRIVSVGIGVNVALAVDTLFFVGAGVLDIYFVGLVPQDEMNIEIRQRVSNDVFTMCLL
jgi:hypothetical protein